MTKVPPLCISSINTGDRLFEQVSDGKEAWFIVRDRAGTQSTAEDAVDTSGRHVIPLFGAAVAPLCFGSGRRAGLRLPSEAVPYGTVEELDRRLEAHLREYLHLPEHLVPLIPLYVRSTWLADRSRTAPYLRLSGPSGSGKSRASQVIGHLCRLPYMTNATASEASIFRNMARLGVCTTVIDENEDDPDSSGQRAITKLLKVGFDQDGAVERCAKVRTKGREGHESERFPVFGPKIICAIDHVPDAPLRSRCIEVHMTKSRIPPVELLPEYEAEVQALQNHLLQYRLDNFFAELRKPEKLAGVDGRLLQLYWPLAKVATEGNLSALQELIYEMQADRDEADQSDEEPRLSRALWDLASEPGDAPITYDALGSAAKIRAQKIGYFVKGLGLSATRKGNRGPRMLTCPRQEILDALRAQGYGPEAQDEAA